MRLHRVSAIGFLVALSVLAPPLHVRAQVADGLDVVLRGGRVIDPETGLDAVRNVGIRGDRIVEISSQPLTGREVVDVTGLVVAPGFIDLHSHGQSNASNEYQAHDGVTTALELESGVGFVAEFLEARTGHAMLNYGASAGHGEVRWRAFAKYAAAARQALDAVGAEGIGSEALEAAETAALPSRYEVMTPAEIAVTIGLLEEGLEEGALGLGVPVGYYPGASREEMLRVYQLSAQRDAPVFTHVRDTNLGAIQEAASYAAVTGAPLHIVHINSMSLGEIGVALEVVTSAQQRGLDITTELYPYTAASTYLESSLFDPGWQERMGISFRDLQWQDTGERLTEETFATYRQQGGAVIIHMMKPEWIEQGVAAPVTMIASDAMPYAPGAHPRSAGTFSRVLGRYVREARALSLVDALAKMTVRPARRLEGIAPSMRLKGRLQVGADADVTVFDPARILDTATFEGGLSFSEGVVHVMVNGSFVVRDGETVEDVYPGRAVMGRYRR